MAKGQNTAKATFRMGLLTWSVLLMLGSALSVLGLVFARRHGYENTVLWLGFTTVTLWFVALVCLGFKVFQITERRKRPRTPPRHISTDAEYVAEYSGGDRGIGLVLMAVFCALLIFLALRSSRMTAIAISAGFFCFFFWYSVQLIVTRVKFTRERIVARLPLFREISEPYAHVVRLRSKPGTLLVDFANGHRLKLHSGLGDPDIILAYLHSHCPEIRN